MAFSLWEGIEPHTADLESASATTAPHGMIANKFIGAVGLVQMHFSERDCNLGRFVFYFSYIPLWNTNFQEIEFSFPDLILPVSPYSLYQKNNRQ